MARVNPNSYKAQPLLAAQIENGRALLSVLSIMAFLACLALLFTRGAARLSTQWQTDLRNSATVQILSLNAENVQSDQDKARQIITEFLPDTAIVPLSQQQSKDLLRPWLGDVRLPDNLAIPSIITLKSQSGTLPLAQIKAALNAHDLQVNIDDHQYYSAGLKQTARSLHYGSLSLLLLIFFAAIAMHIFATRTGLIAQRSITHILVQVGASDIFIAKLFITQAAKRASLGALIGAAIAFLIWLILSMGGLGGFKSFGLTWPNLAACLIDAIYLIILGGGFIILSAVTAGITAQRQLISERRRR